MPALLTRASILLWSEPQVHIEVEAWEDERADIPSMLALNCFRCSSNGVFIDNIDLHKLYRTSWALRLQFFDGGIAFVDRARSKKDMVRRLREQLTSYFKANSTVG